MLWRKAAADHPLSNPGHSDGVHLTLGELVGSRAEAAALSFGKRISAGLQHGAERSRFRGRGMDFDEVRPYQAGDDPRSIDWRVTARTGRTHTKLYTEERERPVHLLLDQSESLFFGSRQAFKAVTAARAAALLAWCALAAGQRVGTLAFGKPGHLELKPSGSRRAVMAMFRALTDRHNAALLSATALRPSGLNEALQRLREVVRPGSLVFVLSDLLELDEQSQRLLAEIARHSDVQLILISDPLERALPPPGRYTYADGEQRLPLDTGNPVLRLSFGQRWQARREACQAFCARARIRYAELGTEQALAETLKAALASPLAASRARPEYQP